MARKLITLQAGAVPGPRTYKLAAEFAGIRGQSLRRVGLVFRIG